VLKHEAKNDLISAALRISQAAFTRLSSLCGYAEVMA
jgi:hypothetical protein